MTDCRCARFRPPRSRWRAWRAYLLPVTAGGLFGLAAAQGSVAGMVAAGVAFAGGLLVVVVTR